MSNFKTPSEYNLKVDFSKVVWPPMEAWVMKRVTELLKGVEDEVLVGTILESLKTVRDWLQMYKFLVYQAATCQAFFHGCSLYRKQRPRSYTTSLCHFFVTTPRYSSRCDFRRVYFGCIGPQHGPAGLAILWQCLMVMLQIHLACREALYSN